MFAEDFTCVKNGNNDQDFHTPVYIKAIGYYGPWSSMINETSIAVVSGKCWLFDDLRASTLGRQMMRKLLFPNVGRK